MRRRWLALGLSVLTLALVAGCGGDDEEEGADGAATTEQPAPADTGSAETGAEDAGEDDAETGGTAVELSSPEDGSLEFDTTELTAQAGELTIEFENPSQVPHNVTLEDPQAATETITAGTTSLTTDIEPGEYTFFCSVGGHREAGMEGTLTVE